MEEGAATSAKRHVLLDSAIAGDPDAISELLEVMQPDIRRFARRQCRSQDDEDEAVQETLLLLYRRVGTLRAVGALTSWLFVTVQRACWKLARSAVPGSANIDDYAEDPRLSYMPMLSSRMELAEAINALPLHYRSIVILRDVQEFTIDEIAADLALSREAVKGRLSRAHEFLREYLRK